MVFNESIVVHYRMSCEVDCFDVILAIDADAGISFSVLVRTERW